MSRRLRVLHMTYASDAGGLSRYVVDLSVAMRARGHEVAVAGDRGAWQWLFDENGIEFVEVPYKSGPGGVFSAVRRIGKWAKGRWGAKGIDLYHSHYRRPTLAARMLQRLGQPAPILYTLHLSHIGLGWGRRWLSDFGDHTHVASSEAMEWVTGEAGVAGSRATLIPHGVMVDKWPVTSEAERTAARRELGIDPDANGGGRVAVYVGRLDYPKNCNWLIDVAAEWVRRHGHGGFKLLLAGEGPEYSELERRVVREGLSDEVRLLGYQKPLRVYQAADVLLLASLREGFSLVCAEGMCTGLPAVRTRTSGSAELVVPGSTGWTTAIEHDAFVSKAVETLEDLESLRGMRAGCAGHIRGHYTYEKQVEATAELYERLVGGVNGTADERR